MQANHSSRIEHYARTPDDFPSHSADTGAELARTWRAAHEAAMSHDTELGIVRTH